MARGGSRYGAGRPGWRVKAEHCLSLDVRRLAAENLLRASFWVWEWRNAESGTATSTLGMFGGADALRLSYSINGQPAEQHIAIDRTACGFGGTRPWFRCPSCCRRVAKLFLRRGRFACRHCQRLTYASRCEDALDRGWRKQRKLERRLGENWTRPRYMHLATYERIVAAILACEEQREEALAFSFSRWLSLLGARAAEG